MREIGTRRIGLIPPRTLLCPFQRKQQGEGRTRFSLCEAGEETAGHGGSDGLAVTAEPRAAESTSTLLSQRAWASEFTCSCSQRHASRFDFMLTYLDLLT